MATATAWNIDALRSYAARGPSEEEVLEILSSITRTVAIFLYHLELARDALKGIINEAEPQGMDNFKLILGGSEREGELTYAELASEANVIACPIRRAIYGTFSLSLRIC